ncbi:MAG: hypothetical protein Q8P41_01510 [Pseudomonadota bacterium]|nr:hypothetical protein [Pseudomonadota bacterium]
MTLLALLACTEPETLESVSAALAQRAVDDAELPLRSMTALAGLLGETCGVASVEDYTFTSRSAAAMRASTATVDRDETTQTWTFTGVGLDEMDGTLLVDTDASQDNLAVTYTADGLKFTAGIEIRDCDTDIPSVVVGGTGTWSTASLTTSLTLVGVAPANGLGFNPVTAEVPTGGQVRASDETAGWVILLDEVSTLPPDAGVWTGQATGTGWSYAVEVGWP